MPMGLGGRSKLQNSKTKTKTKKNKKSKNKMLEVPEQGWRAQQSGTIKKKKKLSVKIRTFA